MELKAEHSSKKRTGQSPRHMEVLKLPPEVREAMEDTVLTIFADMVNSKASFQQTLTAIYLAGIKHTVHSMKEGQDD